MVTVKKRRIVSLPDEVDLILEILAKRDNVPPATKAAYLIQMAIEMDEDQLWDQRATARDTSGVKYFSHEDAWA
jgi:hypothetical protein